MSNRMRADIQVLRALAVLSVVVYHAELAWLPSGYLGVDVFFVISGFVITRLLREQAESTGRIDLHGFYYRRAWRLLPSAFAVYAACAVAAWFLLARDEARDFFFQVLGGVFFAGNIVLAEQTGYFSGEAELKPLLHIWSLGIEEQFYFFWPLIFLLRRPYWLLAALGGLLLSLGLYLQFQDRYPSETFYYLPFRAWQLLVGAMLALPSADVLHRFISEKKSALRNVLALAALLVLLCMMAGDFESSEIPSMALAATFLTAVVLVLRPDCFNGRSSAPLVHVGNFSYSLYLVHWPLFAFTNNVYLAGSGHEIALMLIVLSFVLAELLHRGVESRYRHVVLSGTGLAWTFTAGAAIVLGMASLPLWLADTERYAEIRRFNYGLDASCAAKERFRPHAACIREGEPGGTRILLWGDSNAMHLAQGLLADSKITLIQATKTVCTPLADAAPVLTHNHRYGVAWSRKCLKFNRSVLEYIARSDVDLVVLSTPFETILEPGNRLLLDNGRQIKVRPDEAVAHMQRTAEAVRALGKRVVFVSPPPRSDYETGACLEKLGRGQPVRGSAAACEIHEFSTYNQRLSAFLNALGQQEPLLNLFEVLCRDGMCRTTENGRFIYRDESHLSYEGSLLLFQRYGLGEQLEALAR